MPRISIDLGTGDGSYVYKTARANPGQFYIGIDANADNMAEYSLKASKKPAKGGLSNVLFVNGTIESLPEELQGLASQVTVLLPWGSLLRAVALPDKSLLHNLAALCQPKATLKVIFGYEAQNELGTMQELGLPEMTADYLDDILKPAYLEAGFKIKWRFIKQDALKTIPSTWAKKLAYGKERRFIEIEGIYVR